MHSKLTFANCGLFFSSVNMTISQIPPIYHDDVIKLKLFPRHWPFMRGIHRSPVNSPHKGQWRRALMFSLIHALKKRLSKQSWGWWFETPSRSLWRYYNVYINVRAHAHGPNEVRPSTSTVLTTEGWILHQNFFRYQWFWNCKEYR